MAAGGAGERSARAEASWAGVRVREPGRGSAAGLARSCVWAAARAGQRGRGEAGLRGVRGEAGPAGWADLGKRFGLGLGFWVAMGLGFLFLFFFSF